MARAGPGRRRLLLLSLPFLLLLLLPPLSFAALPSAPPGKDKPNSGGDPEALRFVSEYFSQSAQRLSSYSWYGNAKLFRFRVPEDTVLLRWLLQASKGRGPECGDTQVTIHFSYGAPPVINPLGTQFPSNMSVRPSYNQTLVLGATLQNSTSVNLTSPAAGDWFLAAHLPEATGKIEVKGFSTPCAYVFQPDLFVLRLVDVSILEPDVPMWRTITQRSRPLHAKIFVPEYSATLRFALQSCTANASAACAVRITLGSATLPQSFQRVLDCPGDDAPCSVLLSSPPWEKWLRITVESLGNPSISFEMTASFTACKGGGAGSFLSVYRSLNQSQEASLLGDEPNATLLATAGARNASGPGRLCLRGQPVIREDLDVVSVHFRVLSDSGVPVQAEAPTVLLLNLNSGMDSGGTLVVNLLWNVTSARPWNATVVACLSATSPVLSPGSPWACRTAFSQGYLRNLTTSAAEATLAVPFPESDNWFLSLQLLCPQASRECEAATAQAAVLAYLTPCWDDCGVYGQCSLLRRHSYLYAACSCKAGWRGWSCTDGSRAQTHGTQMLATLLLTLSNLLFLPAIVIALRRYHLVEAAVYIFTMFFSTFYHACDQPGVVVLCIMDYDTLQFCDFLGSVVSIWVTVLCMARVKKVLKYVLCVLGTLIIAMSLQLDRRGVWNMLAPCLFALVVMTTAWAYRGMKRHHCYPPCWHRWAFFLLPGIGLAVVAIAVYTFMETRENYFYTHSIWHILVASSVAFLLPPGDKRKKSWAWSRELLCRYQICKNDREELYAVT